MRKKIYVFISFMLAICYKTLAQTPQNLPKPSDNEPIDLTSPFSIIYFIAIPALAVLAYIILKRRKNKK
jgi:RsiW-degrading membrane proteinase PrsW (M82 family)